MALEEGNVAICGVDRLWDIYRHIVEPLPHRVHCEDVLHVKVGGVDARLPELGEEGVRALEPATLLGRILIGVHADRFYVDGLPAAERDLKIPELPVLEDFQDLLAFPRDIAVSVRQARRDATSHELLAVRYVD